MPTMSITSPTFRFADHLLEGRLRRSLRGWKREGLSAEQMARELYILTDHEIDVTGQTVRDWLHQLGLMEPAL